MSGSSTTQLAAHRRKITPWGFGDRVRELLLGLQAAEHHRLLGLLSRPHPLHPIGQVGCILPRKGTRST